MKRAAILVLASVLALSAQAAWPLVVVRYTGAVNGDRPHFERLMAVHGEIPGSCDEIWLSAGGIRTVEGVARAACESNGVLLAYQQGRTLGHGPAHDGGAVPGNYTFPEDAWQVGVDGRRIKGVLCPRSPDVLAYERAFAHAVVAALRPASYWLDDDLRMGISAALAAKLNGKAVREPVRAAWLAFNQESLALYAAAARDGAADADPNCRMAYQAVWSDTIYTGRDNRPLLAALSGPNARAVGIRPGAGCYTEAHPRDMVAKALSVAREAERCRDYGFVRNVCYEQETYPRRILQKSPGAIITEGTLALASGADSVSLYWYVGEKPEPLDEYRRGARAVAAARPCWERLANVVRRTRLAGISRYVGSAAAEVAGFDRGGRVRPARPRGPSACVRGHPRDGGGGGVSALVPDGEVARGDDEGRLRAREGPHGGGARRAHEGTHARLPARGRAHGVPRRDRPRGEWKVPRAS